MKLCRSVKSIMPEASFGEVLDCIYSKLIWQPFTLHTGIPGIDNSNNNGIIYLTLVKEVKFDSQRVTFRQDRFSASPPRPPYPPPGCSGHGLHFRPPFLRSSRPSPGKVRDATPGSAGRAVGQPGRGRLWFFPSLLLSDTGTVRAGWPAWTGSPATRAQTRSQTFGDSGRSVGGHTCRGCHIEFETVGTASGAAIGSEGPSQERGASSVQASTKKGAPVAAVKQSTMRLHLVQWYEDLRAQATGQIPPATPRGLAILLRSGMPAWMAACPLVKSEPAAAKIPSTISGTPAPSLAGLSTDLVGVLTNMALSSLKRCYL